MDSIQYIERNSKQVHEELVPGGNLLKWSYNTFLGKATLNLLIKRKFVSALMGRFMNSRFSKGRIAPFIEQNGIDLSQYTVTDSAEFKHFNDFFYRKIKPEKRPLGNGIVSPADGKVLAFQSITDVSQFFIKGTAFTTDCFLNDQQLADKYKNGAMVIVRLAPADYHRFHFPASGKISASKNIKGQYFSVSPLALRKSLEIFCQNKRAYSILSTENAGDVLISEVGATMVGSILQTYQAGTIVGKGEEKGYFAFGGSTVVLLFEPGRIQLDADLLDNTRNGLETTIKMGENIGRAVSL